jgi:hypothetical protein
MVTPYVSQIDLVIGLSLIVFGSTAAGCFGAWLAKCAWQK